MARALMRENVANVNVGRVLFDVQLDAWQKEHWHLFSELVPNPDKYPYSRKVLGRLNKEVQEMKI